MTRIRLQDFGTSRPKLTPEDLEEEQMVLTLATAESIEVDDDEAPSGKRHTVLLTFKETGDRVLWLNLSQLRTLVEHLGEELDEWPDSRVPVERHVAVYRGQRFPKVRVRPAEDWEKALSARGKVTGATRRR